MRPFVMVVVAGEGAVIANLFYTSESSGGGLKNKGARALLQM